MKIYLLVPHTVAVAAQGQLKLGGANFEYCSDTFISVPVVKCQPEFFMDMRLR